MSQYTLLIQEYLPRELANIVYQYYNFEPLVFKVCSQYIKRIISKEKFQSLDIVELCKQATPKIETATDVVRYFLTDYVKEPLSNISDLDQEVVNRDIPNLYQPILYIVTNGIMDKDVIPFCHRFCDLLLCFTTSVYNSLDETEDCNMWLDFINYSLGFPNSWSLLSLRQRE